MVDDNDLSAKCSGSGLRVRGDLLLVGLFAFILAIVLLTLVNPVGTEDVVEMGPVGRSGDTGESRASAEEDPCIECHSESDVIPGVIEDWENSKHAEEDVSCIDCHEGEESDPDTVRHNGYWVSAIVTPLDCSECHPDEVAENDRSLHALGADYYEYLFNKGALPYLESQIDD
ncbi:MAG: hypothetical protein LN414_08305, partial [Candidatus Thermoplasmatota archaeon]|nr:hypothetical protein [Candidatus Thermoplasmatota archaeon]